MAFSRAPPKSPRPKVKHSSPLVSPAALNGISPLLPTRTTLGRRPRQGHQPHLGSVSSPAPLPPASPWLVPERCLRSTNSLKSFLRLNETPQRLPILPAARSLLALLPLQPRPASLFSPLTLPAMRVLGPPSEGALCLHAPSSVN